VYFVILKLPKKLLLIYFRELNFYFDKISRMYKSGQTYEMDIWTNEQNFIIFHQMLSYKYENP